MRAVVRLPPWSAAGDPATVGGDAGVDRAEGGGGEGGEHARVGGDRLGDAFAACQPGSDELVGVGAVGLGAGRADRGAPVAAREVDRLVRQVLGVQAADDLPGGGVDVTGSAAQPDRADAPACGQGGGQPLLVVVAGGAVEQLGVQCPGSRTWSRPVIDQDRDLRQCRAGHARPAPDAGRRQGWWKERGKQGAPGPCRACEAPRFPGLLFSIRVLTQRVMTVAVGWAVPVVAPAPVPVPSGTGVRASAGLLMRPGLACGLPGQVHRCPRRS